MRKTIYAYLGPSGSGKSTLSQVCKDKGIPEIISTTTRKIRLGEVNGINYYFVDDDKFDKMEMLEKSTYAGKKYGLSKSELEFKLTHYDKSFVIIDKYGLQTIKDLYSDIADIKVIYCYCGPETVYNRMVARGSTPEDAKARMENLIATGELSNTEIADFVIITDKHPIEKCQKQLEFILDEM